MPPMRVEERDFELELADTWQRFPRDDAFEWRIDDGRQIIINSYSLSGEARPRDVADKFVEIMRKAHVQVMPRLSLEDVVRAEHTDRLVHTFGAAVPDGTGSFTAIIASTQPVAGRHTVLTFSYTGGERAEGERLFQTLRFLPHADAIRRAETRAGAPPDLARLYPYIVPASYLETTKRPVRELGHGLHVMFAEDCDGVCRVLGADDISAAGHAVDDAFTRSIANLDALLKTQAIPTMMWPVDDGRFIRLGDHWLAAACMLVPGAMAFVAKNLAAEQFDVVIPHRDVLLCYAGPPKAVRTIRQAIRAEERVPHRGGHSTGCGRAAVARYPSACSASSTCSRPARRRSTLRFAHRGVRSCRTARGSTTCRAGSPARTRCSTSSSASCRGATRRCRCTTRSSTCRVCSRPCDPTTPASRSSARCATR
jgi:hypothetical protein